MDTKESLSKDDWISLKARSGLGSIRNICKIHRDEYLNYYEMRQKYCCNPFGTHDKKPVVGDRTITVSNFLRSKVCSQISVPLIPGRKLCKRCGFKANEIMGELVETPSPSLSPPSSKSSQSLSQSQDLFAGLDNPMPLVSIVCWLFEVLETLLFKLIW